jgi:phage gpG-like protein
MTTIFNLLEAAAHFRHMGHTMHQAARIVEQEAKRLIGTYDAQPQWPQLTTATQEDRAKHGFAANEPLLRTGELRDSIEHNSSPTVAHIGSNNMKAVWHEIGTRTVPPRPFLSTALHNKSPVIVRAVRQVIGDYLAAGRMEADLFKFALHALHKIAHELGELIPDDPDDNKRKR